MPRAGDVGAVAPYCGGMSFEEIFNPGLAHTRDQQALDKVRPATEVVGEAPPAQDRVPDVDIPDPGELAPFE